MSPITAEGSIYFDIIFSQEKSFSLTTEGLAFSRHYFISVLCHYVDSILIEKNNNHNNLK